MIRTRFAPSPTGYLHIGNLRTALYSYLFAKKYGGEFVLRVEDTDRERFIADGMQNILHSLYWTGIIPDEGVLLDENGKIKQVGKCGSYIQSERLKTYHEYADKLLDAGNAYYCFCGSERLEKMRQKQHGSHLPSGYDGLCRNLAPSESKKRVLDGESHVIRMKMPKEGYTVFTDIIRGEVRIENSLVDDQVLIKSDGFATYHFAVVIDDHLMKISHVIRGEDWISSVPKHIQLFNFFGWEIPQMAHLPLLLNTDKSKLSKRQGDVAVGDYEKAGYLPQALVNFIALLGWNPGTEREIFSLTDLINEFSLERVGKSGAVFNIEKLNWFNKQYIKLLSDDELVRLSRPWISTNVLSTVDEKILKKAILLERERINSLSELPSAIMFAIKLPKYKPTLLIWKNNSIEITLEIVYNLAELLNKLSVQDWNHQLIEDKVGEWIKSRGFKNGDVLWPMRVALSGSEFSPGPFDIADMLGKNETVNRLNLAKEILASRA